MRRVLTIIHTPFFGGLHNIVSKIAGPMRERGWDLMIGCPPEGSGIGRSREEGIRCVPLPLHRVRRTLDPVTHFQTAVGLVTDVRHIRNAIREHDVELVVVAGLVNPHGGVAARAEGVPVVWQIHSDFAPMWLRRVMMPVVRTLTDTVMVCGQRIADAHPGVEVFGDRMVRFAAPVNTREFVNNAAARARARRLLAMADDRIVVGTVGVRSYQKAHEYLVEAAALLRQQRPNVTFCIMGASIETAADYYRREVIDRATSLGLVQDGTVRFMDPGRQVHELLPGLDVFALSSRSEGIPTALLEAMSCHIASVCTDVGSAGEVVTHGTNGLLVPVADPVRLADAIATLVADPERRDRFGRNGRETIEQLYSLERAVESHCQAFEMAATGRFNRRHQRGAASHAMPAGREL